MARNARVLLISPQPFFQWRGSPIRVGFDAMALAELGHAVDLLVMPVGQDRPLPGVRQFRGPNLTGARELAIGPTAGKAVLDVGLLWKAWRLHRENRYDVIHGIEDAGPIAVWVAGRTGARVVFEKHSDPASYKKGAVRAVVMALYRKAEAFAIRHAAAVIGTGPALVAQARVIAPDTPAHHIFDIPSSLVDAEPEKVRAFRARLQKTPGDVLAMYVGSFAVYQGIDLLFESMPAAARRYPQLRWVVIGGTEAEIAARRAWLAARGLADRVEFPGKIPPDELPSALAAGDVLLSPRIAGSNTPLKLLDYLKAGRAIVANDTEANRLILDESCALLVRPDPESFAEGTATLAADPALRARLAEKGRALIDQTYNYAEFKRRLGACYEEVLGGG